MSAEEGLSSAVADWLFINSWWLLLPFTMLLVVAALIVAFVLLLYMISPLISPKPLKLNGAHVVVSEAPELTEALGLESVDFTLSNCVSTLTTLFLTSHFD